MPHFVRPLANFAGYHVIRDDQEWIVPEGKLTEEECARVEEWKRSPEARKAFGIELRRVRRPMDKVGKAITKLLESKPVGQRTMTDAELEACLVGAPEHVREVEYAVFKRRPVSGD
jgi:hypothetical protein